MDQAALDRAILSVADSAYGAAGGEAPFDAVVDAMRVVLPQVRTVVMHHFVHNDRYDVAGATDLERWDDYVSYYVQSNPWIEAQNKIPLGEVSYSDVTGCSREQLMKTPFGGEFLRDHDGVDVAAATGMALYREDGGTAMFASHYSDAFSQDSEKMTFLHGLIGEAGRHLQRAFSLQRRMASLEHRAALAASGLDSLPEAVFLCSGDARVLERNTAAERLLSAGGFVRENCLGGLSATARSSGGDLRTVIANAARFEPSVNGPEALRLVSNMGDIRDVFVAPLRVRTRAFPGMPPMDRSTVLVIVSDPAHTPRSPGRILSALFGLTAAEAALGEALLEGLSIAEFAERRGISPNTVKSQLRAIMAKTDTSRQSDLIALFGRSVKWLPAGVL